MSSAGACAWCLVSHKVAAHAVKASGEVMQLMQEEQYITRLETEGSPERPGGLPTTRASVGVPELNSENCRVGPAGPFRPGRGPAEAAPVRSGIAQSLV